MLFKFHKVSVYNKIPLSYDFVLVIADSLRIEPFPGLTVLSSLLQFPILRYYIDMFYSGMK